MGMTSGNKTTRPCISGTGDPEGGMRDPRRFEQLALPHLDAAYALAFWLMRDRADAEDVAQDAYVLALRGFESFRGDNIRPWLLAIVRNAALRALARRKRRDNVIPIESAYVPGEEEGSRAFDPPSNEPSAEARLIEA